MVFFHPHEDVYKRQEELCMNKEFYIGSRRVGQDAPVFIVAEMSANHLQDYGRAIEIIHAAKELSLIHI